VKATVGENDLGENTAGQTWKGEGVKGEWELFFSPAIGDCPVIEYF
jgi:hypothetical protein